MSAEVVAPLLLLLLLLNKKKSRACTLAIPTATFVSSQSPKASNVRSDFFLRSKLYNDDVPSSPVFVYTLNLVISSFASFALLLKVVPFPIWSSFWWSSFFVASSSPAFVVCCSPPPPPPPVCSSTKKVVSLVVLVIFSKQTDQNCGEIVPQKRIKQPPYKTS